VGRKKPGFADIEGTRAQLANNELRCPKCNRKVASDDPLKFVGTLGHSEPSLATLTCPRCRTMIGIRFVAEKAG